MPYKKISLDVLPPWLKKGGCDYQSLNAIIKKGFEETVLVKEWESSYSNTTTLYLPTSKVDKIVEVLVHNSDESLPDITYTPSFNTDQYCNSITLNRPLSKGEKIEVKYTCTPQINDFLKSDYDSAYIDKCVYDNIINFFYNSKNAFAKSVNIK